MTDSATLTKICSIPRDFQAGSGSPRQLVAESGYRDVRSTLTAAELADYLRTHPALIEDWHTWSQDKRTSEGWYLILHGADGYVGYLGRSDPELRFPSHAEACAQFIVRELADIDSRDLDRDRTT